MGRGVGALGRVAGLVDGDVLAGIAASGPIIRPWGDKVRLDGEARVRDPLGALHGLQIGQGHPALIRPAPAVPLLQHVHHRAHGVRPHLAVAGAGAAADVDADAGRHGVLAHRLVLLFRRCLLRLLEIHANPVVHLAAGGDALSAKVALAGAAPIQHNGGGPAQPGQLVPQSFRRGCVSGPIARAIEGQTATTQADGAAPPLASLGRAVGGLIHRLTGGNKGGYRDKVGRSLVPGGHVDVRALVPGVAHRTPGRAGEHRPAHLKQRAGGAVWVPHAAIEHVMSLCFSLDLRERLAAVGDSQLNPLHGRERDICNELTHLIHILLSSDPAVDYCSGASSPASSWYSSGVSRSAAR